MIDQMNERTHAHARICVIPRFLVLESKTRLSCARWLLASPASHVYHALILMSSTGQWPNMGKD